MPEAEYLQFGGQAVVEGVMMRSPKHFAVACLAPNQEIVVKHEPLEKSWAAQQKWLRLPFIRGGFALIDSMALGIKAMRFASMVQLDPTKQPVPAEPEVAPEAVTPGEGGATYARPQKQEAPPSEQIQSLAIGATLVVSLIFGIGLFVFLPNLIGEYVASKGTDTIKNLVSGLIKFVIFYAYIWLISKLEGIQRVFQFHGAEHKAINCMEAKQELTIENCKAMTRLHPRCGTSFAIVVLIVGFVIFTFIPREIIPVNLTIVKLLIRVLLELPVLFVVAGVSYELIRLAGKFRNTTWVNIMFWPGLMTQYMTTKEPDEKQIEVAIKSLEAVIEAEKESAAATAVSA